MENLIRSVGRIEYALIRIYHCIYPNFQKAVRPGDGFLMDTKCILWHIKFVRFDKKVIIYVMGLSKVIYSLGKFYNVRHYNIIIA